MPHTCEGAMKDAQLWPRVDLRCSVMIRLRASIDRGRRHPLLGPLLIVVLVLVIALMMLHEGQESAVADLGPLCIGITLLLLRGVIARPATPESVRTPDAVAARAPPRTMLHLLAVAGDAGARSLPLRR